MDWIENKTFEERASLASRGDSGLISNPDSSQLWQTGNSLADNMRILANTTTTKKYLD